VDCCDLNPLRSCVTSRWRAIRKDLPPVGTINCYFSRCQHDGTLKRVYHALHVFCRESAIGEASSTAGIVDSQSVETTENGGRGLIRQAFTAAKRSKAASGIFWSIRKAC
jgi:transposase